MSCGLYVHIPFCSSKCPYCSFASFSGMSDIAEDYCRAARKELLHRISAQELSSFSTVYIGGGTPSTVSSTTLASILAGVSIDDVIEFTVEANPGSVSPEWLDGMLRSGANRISIGVQSFDEMVLSRLGRIHSAHDAADAVGLARKAGLENVSIDLMFGVPGQTFEIWRDTLATVLTLDVDHVSCYSLGVEEDSSFFELMKNERLDIPDAEVTSDMYMLMKEELVANGFKRYELSNFAKPGFESKHNASYWNFTPFIGIGASAHSFDGVQRSWNLKDPRDYIGHIEKSCSAVEASEDIDNDKRLAETIMLALRTERGIEPGFIKSLTGRQISDISTVIDRMLDERYLEKSASGALRISDCGIMIADEIISEILTAL